MIEHRRSRRFELQLPLKVMRTGTRRICRSGQTRNISSGGVLFTSNERVEIGGPIEYVVTLLSGTPSTVTLRCLGKVLRIEKLPPTEDLPLGGFHVAATLERYEFHRLNGTGK